jgi:uncharacterized protein
LLRGFAGLQHKAVALQHIDIVVALLAHGAQPGVFDAWGRTPLDIALQLGNVNAAKALCKHGAQAQQARELCSMLADAADSEESKLHLMCTSAGVDVNVRDLDGRTSLHLAVAQHRWKAVHNIIDMGADVNAEDRCCLHGLYWLRPQSVCQIAI